MPARHSNPSRHSFGSTERRVGGLPLGARLALGCVSTILTRRRNIWEQRRRGCSLSQRDHIQVRKKGHNKQRSVCSWISPSDRAWSACLAYLLGRETAQAICMIRQPRHDPDEACRLSRTRRDELGPLLPVRLRAPSGTSKPYQRQSRHPSKHHCDRRH